MVKYVIIKVSISQRAGVIEYVTRKSRAVENIPIHLTYF